MSWPSNSTRTKLWGTEILTASDLDGQYDLLHQYFIDALNGSTGHKHTGGANDGQQIVLTTGITGTLPIANGGTNVTTYTQGDILYCSAANVLSKLGAGTVGQVLLTGGSGANPAWGNVPYIKCTNTQSQNVAGGASTSGSWLTAILNTKDNDTNSLATLSTNTISLPIGTYEFCGRMPFYNGTSACNSQIRLFNSSDSAVLVVGNSIVKGINEDLEIVCSISGLFTIGATKNIVLQYQVSSSQAINGQGSPLNFGTEMYAVIEFWKVA